MRRGSRHPQTARGMYDAIVVDTAPLFDGPMLTALDRSDQLLLVSTPDVPSMKNIRLALQTLELLGFPVERIALVANRSGMSGRRVGRRDGRHDRARRSGSCSRRTPLVPKSINSGVPAVVFEAAGAVLTRRQGHRRRACRRERDVQAGRRPGRERRRRRGAGTVNLNDRIARGNDESRRRDRARSARLPASASTTATATGNAVRTSRPPPPVDPARRAEEPDPPRLHRQARHGALHDRVDARSSRRSSSDAVAEELAIDRTPL